MKSPASVRSRPVPAAPAAGPAGRLVAWLRAGAASAPHTVSAILPPQHERDRDGATATSGPSDPPRAHVMIVDDNVDAADTLADLLRLDGYTVDVCYDERQALASATGHAPDIVILDLALPERGGHALARDLRAVLPAALLIAFTGFSGSEDVERSLQSGIDEHWVKPMSASSFTLALAAAHARHRAHG
jgi:CheY-like chemotaxis protein